MQQNIYYEVVCQDFSIFNYNDGKLSKLSLERRNNKDTNMLRPNVWFNN